MNFEHTIFASNYSQIRDHDSANFLIQLGFFGLHNSSILSSKAIEGEASQHFICYQRLFLTHSIDKNRKFFGTQNIRM